MQQQQQLWLLTVSKVPDVEVVVTEILEQMVVSGHDVACRIRTRVVLGNTGILWQFR